MPSDFQKAEYEALNNEIQEHSTRLYQVLAFAVGGAGGLLGYVFNLDRTKSGYNELFPPFLFLLPFLVLAPSSLLVQSCLHSTARIASYIQFKYENSETGIAWQTDIQAYRDFQKRNAQPFWRFKETFRGLGFWRRPFRWALVSVFGSLGLTSILASFVAFWIAIHTHIFASINRKHTFCALYLTASFFLLGLLVMACVSLFKGWSAAAFQAEGTTWESVGRGGNQAGHPRGPDTR